MGKTNPKQTQFYRGVASGEAGNKPNSNPTCRGVASGEAGFQTANLLIERTKSRLLDFQLKINLTVCRYSLKYLVLYCERDFL
jgi:hypothetical protein